MLFAPVRPVWPPGHPKAGKPYDPLDDDPANFNWELAEEYSRWVAMSKADSPWGRLYEKYREYVKIGFVAQAGPEKTTKHYL